MLHTAFHIFLGSCEYKPSGLKPFVPQSGILLNPALCLAWAVTCSIPEICHNGVRGSVRMYIFLFVWPKKGLSVHVNDLQLPLM